MPVRVRTNTCFLRDMWSQLIACFSMAAHVVSQGSVIHIEESVTHPLPRPCTHTRPQLTRVPVIDRGVRDSTPSHVCPEHLHSIGFSSSGCLWPHRDSNVWSLDNGANAFLLWFSGRLCFIALCYVWDPDMTENFTLYFSIEMTRIYHQPVTP